MDQIETAKLDGFAEPDWNVAQAIVWVATRSREWVDDCSDRSKHASRAYGFAVVPITVDRHFGASTWDNAVEALRGALRAGRMTAWGTDQHGTRRRIESGEWQDLDFRHFIRRGPPPVRRLNYEKQLGKGEIEPFQNVRMGRSDLIREWPELETRAKSRTFKQGRWPLHFALAWVLTRDCAFAERAKPSDFHPHLNEDDWISGEEVDQAWSLLHQALAGGIVPAFETSKLCGDSDVGEASEERIAPEALARLDWDDLKTGRSDPGAVVVSSSAMISQFTPGSDPIAFTSDHAGLPIRPDGPGYMALSDAAYWIATKGGTKRIVMRDLSVWKGAFAELLRYVQTGEVCVVGRRGGASLPETIDGASFVGLPINYPYTEAQLSVGEPPHIEGGAVLLLETDETDKFSDKLWGFNRYTPEWTHLQVRRLDIRKWWPFSEEEGAKPECADAPDLTSAIEMRLRRGEVPGSTIPWKQFVTEVRSECSAWVSGKSSVAKRGFSDKTIRRRVQELCGTNRP